MSVRYRAILVVGVGIVLLGLGSFRLHGRANDQRATAKLGRVMALRNSQGIVVKGQVKALAKQRPTTVKISNEGSYVYMKLASKGTFYVNVSMAISIKAKTVDVVAGRYITQNQHKEFVKMSPINHVKVVKSK